MKKHRGLLAGIVIGYLLATLIKCVPLFWNGAVWTGWWGFILLALICIVICGAIGAVCDARRAAQ